MTWRLMLLPALLATAGAPQDDAKLDKYARDACGRHPLIRVQAARRLVAAGEAGFRAVERLIAREGAGALPAELVRSLGRFEIDDARRLLKDLVADEAFPWRALALRAIAETPRAEERELLERHLEHGSWLMRRAALTGWHALDPKAATPALRASLADGDPRVRVLAAALLLKDGDATGLPVLVAGLDADEVFCGDDLGFPLRREAFAALREWAGDDLGYSPRVPHAERREAVERFRERASRALDRELVLPERPPRRSYSLGFERRSCSQGDLYLRVDRRGDVWRGVFTPRRVEAPAGLTDRLLRAAMTVGGKVPRVFGKIGCDFDRYAGFGGHGKGSVRCAPGTVPEPLREIAELFAKLSD